MLFKLLIIILFTSLFMDYLCQEIKDTTKKISLTELDIEAEYNDEITSEKPTKLQDYYRRASMGDSYCAREPGSLRSCIPNENTVNDTKDVYKKCYITKEIHEECKPYECVYDNMGTELRPGPFRQYIREYIKVNPDMKEAVNIAIRNCVDVELRPQGVMKNCPAYDIHICITNEMIKNTPISVWDPGCMQEREYYIRCHVCPIICRAQSYMEPGTCSACADI